jgi:radical SAM superfamily enzyme YgiQ (UPF0313 family)
MLASEDMFLYEQLPNFETNVPALEKLFRSVAAVPGIETIQTSHITLAPVVKDPSIIERLTPLVVPYSHLRHKDSTDPDKRVADPIIGLETGSARLFNTYMKGKAYPYKAGQWRDVVLKGMEILNRHNWFPFCTFIIGLPGETDDDTKQSLDLLCADVLRATRKHAHGAEGQREADRDDGSSMGVLLHVLEVKPGVLAQWQ